MAEQSDLIEKSGQSLTEEVRAGVTTTRLQIAGALWLARQMSLPMAHAVDAAGRLAQRSAQAAREIKGLIGTSVARVEHGSSLVDDAGRTMDQATQQNAALVEQSAAAADSLKQQAQQLVQAVSAFRLR